MAAFLLDLDQNFKDVTESVKGVYKGLLDLDKSFSNTATSGKGAATAFKDINKGLEQVKLSGAATAKVAWSLFTGFAAVADVAFKLKALKDIADAGYVAWSKFKGVSETLDFATAITGSNQLATNFQVLEKVANSTFNKIELASAAIFNPSEFNKWSSSAVSAYAQVEQAAYKLATVTTSTNERSINKLKDSIKITRELQKATQDALGSVDLLNTQYDIASAGFAAKQDNLNVGKASVNLSQAGFGNVAGSTNAIVRALRALGDSSDEAGKRAAQLFETTRVGLLSLDQLTPEVGSLAVASKNLGIEFSEVSAALAGLTTQGISASEASTRLQAFFSEVVGGSQEANQYLSKFRDEAGKPIQLNATALREKGIGGVIGDLKKATGGSQSALQQIFGRQESIEAVQLLSNLGQEDLKKYQTGIENASGTRLDEEAKNRNKTVTGSFQRAANASQRQVENFGQGLAPSVIERVAETNEVVEKLITTSAEGIGSLTGFLSGFSSKIQAVGGFIAAAFSAIAPFAFFEALRVGFVKISAKFKDLQKEGETPWQTLERVAYNFIAKAEERLIQLVKRVRDGISDIKEDLNSVRANDNKGDKQLQNKPALPAGVDGGDLTISPGTAPTRAPRIPKAASTPKINLGEAVTEGVGSRNPFPNLTQAFKNLSAAGGKAGGVIKGAFSAATPIIGAFGKYLGALAIGGGLAVAGLSIVGGWANTLSQTLNSKTIPAVIELRESLSTLENVKGLDQFLRSIDPVTSSVQGTNGAMNVLNETLERTKGAWSDLTGASFSYFNNVKPKTEEADRLLKESIDRKLNAFNEGGFGAVSDGAKTAENKRSKGIALSQDDYKALEDDNNSVAKQADARVALKRKDVEELQKLGKVDAAAKAQEELKILEQQVKAQKEKLKVKLQEIKLEESVKRLQSIDTRVPLQLQISSQNEEAVSTQIKDIGTKFKDGLSGALKDPAAFDRLGSDLSNAIGSIETQLEIDPASTARLRDELRSQLAGAGGESGFDKLVASNPQLRQKSAALNTKVTEANLKNAQTQEGVDTTLLNTAQSLGSQSSAVAAAKFEAQTKSINAQVKILNDELSRPETSLLRQKDILAQIEQLEAQRAQAAADNRISSELGSRKQTLTLTEQLLDVEKARVSLFNEESRFGSLAITAAESRLQAAVKELQVKKESLSISTREEVIRKEEVVNSLKAKAAREEGEVSRITRGKDDSQIRQDAEKSKAEQRTKNEKELAAAREDAARKIKELESSPLNFNKDEVEKIKKAKGGVFLDEQGNLKGSASVASNQLNEYADFIGRNANDQADEVSLIAPTKAISASVLYGKSNEAREAAVLIADKATERRVAIANAKKEADEKIKAVQKQTSEDAARTDNLTERQIAQANEAKGSKFGKDALGTASNIASSNNQSVSTSAQDDLKFGKLLADVKQRFGLLNEQIIVNEAAIAKEFAGREKLIKRGELLGETLSQIAQNGAIFGNSVAGAALNLAALETSNKSGRLDKEADEEIAKINSKVKTLAENASVAEDAATKARQGGARPEVQSKLDEQAAKAKELASKAQSESGGDIAFVRQKTALDKLAATIEASEAKINLEFKAREQLVERTNTLADSFGTLANSAIVANSTAAASLQRVQAELKNKAVENDPSAEKGVAQINERIKTLEALGKQSGAVGEAARKQLPQAKQEASAEIQALKTQAALSVVSANLELSAAKVKEELSVRQRLIELSEGLGGAFNTLASTASSLFQNSSLGATLNKFAAELSSGTGKASKEYDEQTKLLNARNDALKKAVQTAEAEGADKGTVAKLRDAANRDSAQKPVEQAYLRQRLILDTLNERLGVMSAAVNEATDAMNKTAALSKEGIDFQQRGRELTGESNAAGRGLQTALVGAFAKNNPFAELIQKRSEFRQAGDEGDLQKSRNTTEAKKEVIDLSLQKQQLILEQQSYENAITQTQLLSDLVNIQQGGTAQFSSTEDVKNRLNQLPALIESSRQAASERLNFVQQKLDFIPKELEQKNRNVDMGTSTRRLGIVSQGGTFDPSMLSEIREVLGKSTQDLKDFRPEKIDTGSLNDPQFRSDLARLQGVGRNNGSAQATIQAPVNINLNITGADASNFSKDMEQNMKQLISRQVQAAFGQLGKQLVASSGKV